MAHDDSSLAAKQALVITGMQSLENKGGEHTTIYRSGDLETSTAAKQGRSAQESDSVDAHLHLGRRNSLLSKNHLKLAAHPHICLVLILPQ